MPCLLQGIRPAEWVNRPQAFCFLAGMPGVNYPDQYFVVAYRFVTLRHLYIKRAYPSLFSWKRNEQCSGGK